MILNNCENCENCEKCRIKDICKGTKSVQLHFPLGVEQYNNLCTLKARYGFRTWGDFAEGALQVFSGHSINGGDSLSGDCSPLKKKEKTSVRACVDKESYDKLFAYKVLCCSTWSELVDRFISIVEVSNSEKDDGLSGGGI